MVAQRWVVLVRLVLGRGLLERLVGEGGQGEWVLLKSDGDRVTEMKCVEESACSREGKMADWYTDYGTMVDEQGRERERRCVRDYQMKQL